MKKFTFVLAALFAATLSNAQIALEHSFPNGQVGAQVIVSSSHGSKGDRNLFGPYISMFSNNNVTIFSLEDFRQVGLVAVTSKNFFFLSRNIFTTDGEFTYIAFTESTTEFKTYDGVNYPCDDIHLYDKNGNVIMDLGSCFEAGPIYLLKLGDGYKLAIMRADDSIDIYSLPGNGETQDISAPSSPKRSSSRKIARDGQILIETENITYTVTGQEVR